MNIKKTYLNPVFTVTEFDSADILTASVALDPDEIELLPLLVSADCR